MTAVSGWSGRRFRNRGLLALSALVLAATMGLTSPSGPANAAPRSPSNHDPIALRIGSYNVRCANCYQGRGAEGTWPQRRGAVVATIRSQDVDVLGVQEASPGKLKDSRGRKYDLSQFEDLALRLGSPYKLVNAYRYNCVDSTKPKPCVRKDRGASLRTRLFYNTNRIALMDSGAKLLPETNTGGTRHAMEWAHFQQLSTGLEFMVSDGHLTAFVGNNRLRQTQAEVALAELKAHNPDQLSMIAVGDWNSSRGNTQGNLPYEVYLRAGFVDPLGAVPGPEGTSGRKGVVERRINTWMNSWNGFQRGNTGSRSVVNGTYLDYILTTPMRVSEWETVANLDPNGVIEGVVPSDHNMVRATVYLPDP